MDGGRALCLELPTLSRAASDSFTTIDQPGASDTYLYGINDIGGIVGAFPGFQYENGVFTDIPAPRPSDINNAGQIVGTYEDSASRLFSFQAAPAVPEPSTAALVGVSLLLAGLGAIRIARARRRQA